MISDEKNIILAAHKTNTQALIKTITRSTTKFSIILLFITKPLYQRIMI